MINGPNYITYFPTSIFAIAGYYTDSDHMQHVIAAADHGNVYQVTWDPSEVAPGYPPPPFDPLGHFDNLVTIAGFFTPDDKYHHAVAGTIVPGTSDRKLHEMWYKLAELPRTNTTVLPYHISSFEPGKGMAGFYSPGDDLRHVVIVDGNGNPVDITWKANHPTNGKTITIPPNISQVASISGFLATDDYSRHIIVARNDTGQIYDIDYPDEQNVPGDIQGQDNVYVRTSFHEPVKNVTAFFSSDTNYRHIVVLTKANWLKDHAYNSYGTNGTNTQLVLAENVVDMTSFYNAHDHLRHVLYVTKDRNLYEITYTSQG